MEQLRFDGAEDGGARVEGALDPALEQWMTPAWAAEAIAAHALPDLPDGAVVIEPSAGEGALLAALPDRVRAIGVEIDPRLAAVARTTGREVVVGDFRTAALPVARCDAFLANPPFDVETIGAFLARMHGMLDEGGPAVMVLPASAFQTPSRVLRWNARWSLSHEMLPRTLFPNLRLPLVLARFVRDARPRLTGFLLYREAHEVAGMPAVYRRALAEGRPAWRAVVEEALRRLGGEATVAEVCDEIGPRRPTATAHWRAKVRQQLAASFPRTARGRYALAA